MKRINFNIKDRKVLYAVLSVVLVCVFMLTVAYSALSAVLTISGNALISSSDWDIYLSNPKVTEGSATTTLPEIKSSATLSFNTTLNMPGDYYEFTVDVVNNGSIDAMIENVVKNPELTTEQAKYLKYEVSYANDISIGVKQLLAKKSSLPIKVRVEYRRDIDASDLPTSQVVLDLSLTLEYIQDDGTGVSVGNSGSYGGLTVSILGDSMSTLKGYISEGNRYRYVQTEAEAVDGLLYMPYEKTWWGRLIEDLGMKLGVNDSWAGSRVSNTSSTDTGDVGPNTAISSMTRLQKLDDNGTPDIIFFYGGANDIGTSVTLGTFNPNLQVDTTSTIISDFATAYAMTILRLQYLYPNTEIIALLPVYAKTYFSDEKLTQYRSMMRDILDYYNIKYIDLIKSGVTTNNLADDSHLNQYGMNLLTQYIKEELIYPTQSTKLANLYKSSTVTNQYYNASGQLTTMEGAGSIMLDVNPGDKVFANSMGSKVMNYSTVDGSRMSYLSNGNFTSTFSPAEVFSNFKKTGYLLVPTGVDKMNVTYPVDSRNNYLYVLNVENLYGTTEVFDKYYDGSGNWGGIVSGVGSMIIDVNPGDKIIANSFGDSSVNNTTSGTNSTRVSYLKDGAFKFSLSNLFVYEEYLKYGYIIVPEGVDQVNVTWWTQSADNYLYIIKN